MTDKAKMPGKFICYRCKHPFRDHTDLQRHYDKKKKCVPLGTVIKPELFCECCKTAFSNKSNYTAHLRTKTHERTLAAVNINITNNDNTINNTQNNNINIQINLTPRDFTSLNYDYLPSLTALQLKQELGLNVKNLEETILNVFRALHTNSSRTDNHNLLLEASGSEKVIVFKVDSWRFEDKIRALNDAICQCTVHLLDLEDIIRQCMSEKDFRTFSQYRDEIEHESANETEDARLKSLLNKVSDILVDFTKERSQTVDHAKEEAARAKPLTYVVAEGLREWAPGGKRYVAAWNNMMSSNY